MWKALLPRHGSGSTPVFDSPSDILVGAHRKPVARPWRAILVGGGTVVGLVAVAMILTGLGSAPGSAPMPSREFASQPGSVPDPVTALVPVVGNTAEPVTPSTTPTRLPTGKEAASTPPATRAQVPDGPIESHTLYVPALGVRAHTVSTGIVNGLLNIPADVAEVTVWKGSSGLAADSGTVLVAGHVDNARQGKGAMWPLHLVRPGDAVYLTGEAEVTRWKVVGVQSVVKSALPKDVWAGEEGPRVLKLVTCGGEIMDGNYLNNVIVTAVPF